MRPFPDATASGCRRPNQSVNYGFQTREGHIRDRFKRSEKALVEKCVLADTLWAVPTFTTFENPSSIKRLGNRSLTLQNIWIYRKTTHRQQTTTTVANLNYVKFKMRKCIFNKVI